MAIFIYRISFFPYRPPHHALPPPHSSGHKKHFTILCQSKPIPSQSNIHTKQKRWEQKETFLRIYIPLDFLGMALALITRRQSGWRRQMDGGQTNKPQKLKKVIKFKLFGITFWICCVNCWNHWPNWYFII